MWWTNEDSETYFQNHADDINPIQDDIKSVCLTSWDGVIATSDDWLDTFLWISRFKEVVI
jgi:hypothetical protein